METLEDVAAAAASSAVKTVASFDSVKTEITMIMEVINGIPEFDGHPIDLQEFAFLILATHAQLAAASSMLREVRVRNLYNMLVRRVSTGVRADVGITSHTPVQEMLNKLKARYAGARRPVARTALKVFRMRRDGGETPQQFAHKLDPALRTLKEGAVEEYGASEAAPKVAVYEEIAREVLMAEMPDKIRRQLRDGTQRSLEAALVVVDDDEDEVRAAREEREIGATRASANGSTNAMTSARVISVIDKRSPRDRLYSVSCAGPVGARDICRGSRKRPVGPGPMEVNATAATRRERRRNPSRRECNGSDSASSSVLERSPDSCTSGSEGAAARKKSYAAARRNRTTRFALAHQLTNKTAAEVCTGLLSFFGTVGLPGTLVVDRGREFHNAGVKSLLEEFGIRAHFTTPGHPRSHSTVERLHSTMAEHLRLLKLDRGLEGSEAVARAVLAYNQLVHVAYADVANAHRLTTT
ncbi:hypothetical protein AAG570_004269 [Ranatra chinensis]|uniref:Integrase catalytic domain-containing protein n=1 Tax=Ranatra chinensis TaxID=642074 RepID=A0ABD0YHS8_9HEMI